MKKSLVIIAIVAMLALTACTKSEQPPVSDGTPPEVGTSDDAPFMHLKTEGYREQSIHEFDEAFAPYQEVFDGWGRNEADIEFKTTLLLARMELLYNSDSFDEDEWPVYSLSVATEAGLLSLDISWNIPDKNTVTVGQRDDLVNSAVVQMEAAANAIGPESDDAMNVLQIAADEIAGQLSTDWGTIEIVVDSIE